MLRGIAPEVDTSAVADATNLRREFDLDSIDYQNFLVAVHRRFGVAISDRDSGRLASLAGCIEFLGGRKPDGRE